MIAVTEIDGQTSIYSVAPNRGILNAKIAEFLKGWYDETVKDDSVELIKCHDQENGCVYLKVRHLRKKF